MLRVSLSKKITALTILMASTGLCAKSNYPIPEDFYSPDTLAKIYLKDASSSLLEGAVGQENMIEAKFFGLEMALSVEEFNEALVHLLEGLCHAKKLKSTAQDVVVALTAAKATSYLIVALNNLGIQLPEWIRRHSKINYHVRTILKGVTRKSIRGWLNDFCNKK